MEKHFELIDPEFEKQFENCELSPELFNHEAHLRLAWIHITKYGILQAIKNIREQLIQYTSSLGPRDKYNETVTIAAAKAVYHFMLKSQTNNFSNFIKENHRLKNNFKDLLSCHYTIDIFKLPAAKNKYLEPQLLPFDI